MIHIDIYHLIFQFLYKKNFSQKANIKKRKIHKIGWSAQKVKEYKNNKYFMFYLKKLFIYLIYVEL